MRSDNFPNARALVVAWAFACMLALSVSRALSQEADSAAAAAAARDNATAAAQKRKKKKPGVFAFGGKLLKHVFGPSDGAGKGKGKRRKAGTDPAADDADDVQEPAAGDEDAGRADEELADGREGAEGKDQVGGKPGGKKGGKKKNVFDNAGGGPISAMGVFGMTKNNKEDDDDKDGNALLRCCLLKIKNNR